MKKTGKKQAKDVEKDLSTIRKEVGKDTQFKPGETGNPEGRPKGKRNKDTLFELAIESLAMKYVEDHNKDKKNKTKITIEDVDIEADIFKQFVNKARNGDFKAILGFMEHRHGKAVQTLVHTGDDQNPVIVEERKAKKKREVERILNGWTKEEEQ